MPSIVDIVFMILVAGILKNVIERLSGVKES